MTDFQAIRYAIIFTIVAFVIQLTVALAIIL